MPLLPPPDYSPSGLFRNAHVATVVPSQLRRIAPPPGRRERLDTPDGDFIDLDRWYGDAGPIVLLCHGLEGDSSRHYMRGMARAFARRGWRVVAYNYRGCSGEPNRTPRSYHSGATDDLRLVVEHVRPTALVGFSLGGNLVLKYLGEAPGDVHAGLAAAVAISTPVDLAAGADRLAERGNWFYNKRFLRKLARKVRQKARFFPDAVDPAPLARLRTLRDFDDVYTAPLHGFADADDYYRRCSALQFLPAIELPTLMISAWDDPFLGPTCFPTAIARDSGALHLETPTRGGHCGFRLPGPEYWSEARAATFATSRLCV